MSLRVSALNAALRLFERRFLSRVTDPVEAREAFARKARILFRADKSVPVAEGRLGALECLEIGPSSAGVLLYFHGGAYIFGAPRTHAAMLAKLSKMTGMQAVLPDYRLAPDAPFPAAFDDAVASYEALIARGVAPNDIVIGGDSAGGGLALALLGHICAKALPQPRGCFALSAYTDMRNSGPSVTRNAAAEAILPAARMDEIGQMYLQGQDAGDPRASPIYADFSGACPVYLAASLDEILLDDSRRLATRMRDVGGEVHLHLRSQMPHVWHMFHRYLPQAGDDLAHLSGWIKTLSTR